MRRVCWAWIMFSSRPPRCLKASSTPSSVISWKTARTMFGLSSAMSWLRCQEMASPSRSGSAARMTRSLDLAALRSSATTFFFSGMTW